MALRRCPAHAAPTLPLPQGLVFFTPHPTRPPPSPHAGLPGPQQPATRHAAGCHDAGPERVRPPGNRMHTLTAHIATDPNPDRQPATQQPTPPSCALPLLGSCCHRRALVCTGRACSSRPQRTPACPPPPPPRAPHTAPPCLPWAQLRCGAHRARAAPGPHAAGDHGVCQLAGGAHCGGPAGGGRQRFAPSVRGGEGAPSPREAGSAQKGTCAWALGTPTVASSGMCHLPRRLARDGSLCPPHGWPQALAMIPSHVPPARPSCHLPASPQPQAGGNDYVCKPFSGRELVARIQAQLRIRQFAQGVAPPAGSGAACNGAGSSSSERTHSPEGPTQGGSAAPANGLAASPDRGSIQGQMDQLQQQLLSAQRQLAALAAAAGSAPAPTAAQDAPVAAQGAPVANGTGRSSTSDDSHDSRSSDSAGTGTSHELAQGAACACAGGCEGAIPSSKAGEGAVTAGLAAA